MIIKRKALPRRAFLRGVGATLSLPLLDAMIPAMTALAATPALPVKRLGFVYVPMGSNYARFAPRELGTMTELSPILQPLSPFLGQMTVLGNVENKLAYSAGNHATANSCYLSAAEAKMTEGSDYRLGTTVDQIAAKQIGKDSRLPSLELAMDLIATVGNCAAGYACVYQNDLSWSSPTTPLPAEAHPRVVFERLFGDGGSNAEQLVELKRNASLLDWVGEDIAQLQKKLGPNDRSKVNDYLDSVREVERRIQKAEKHTADSPLPSLDRPVGVPASYEEHAKLMFDLQVLALQGDVTRVITFQLAREASTRTYPETGVPEPHHPVSHHANDPKQLEKLAKINTYHVSLFAYYLDKLKATREGDGTLLDHSLILYGSGIGNPDIHDHIDLPLVLAGGGAGSVRGGRHIRFTQPPPLANLHVTLLNRVGVHVDSFGDSTGMITELL